MLCTGGGRKASSLPKPNTSVFGSRILRFLRGLRTKISELFEHGESYTLLEHKKENRKMQNKWDKRFIELAEFISSWSQDPSTKVGAVIVDDKKRIVSVGFNGFPRGVADDARLSIRQEKYERIVHAEVNAIMFSQKALTGCTLYVWPMPPCARCATLIIQSGIARVYAPACPPNSSWNTSADIGKEMFSEAGVSWEYI